MLLDPSPTCTPAPAIVQSEAHFTAATITSRGVGTKVFTTCCALLAFILVCKVTATGSRSHIQGEGHSKKYQPRAQSENKPSPNPQQSLLSKVLTLNII